jgi:galactokinase
MGGHTDYNEGLVLPLAIDRRCVLAGRASESMRVRSLDLEGTLEIQADGSAEPRSVEPSWGRCVAGVVRELAARGRPPVGIDAVLASDVPIGAGLSSSAALEVAVALALAAVAKWELEQLELARACRAAEESGTGVPCGIMDQLVSLGGVEGAALLVDCRSLEVTPVSLPASLAVFAVHCGVSRSLAAGEYARRRSACEQLARDLGIAALRDATPEQAGVDPLVRHAVTENARVLETVDALTADDRERLGRIFLASHASLCEDVGVTTPELDLLVDELVSAGAYGARLTGGGFGGCVVAVSDADSAAAVAETAMRRYREATGLEPRLYECPAVGGAEAFDGPARPSA